MLSYLGGIGSFTCSSFDTDDIAPTPEGSAIGIIDDLDVCCWHDEYVDFPSFLGVLATYTNTNPSKVAAVGGEQVVIPGFVLTPAAAVNEVGTNHTVTIHVTRTSGGQSFPVPDVPVTFAVNGAHTTGGSCLTDATGRCSFTYPGTNVGNDVITATATVLGRVMTATAHKQWTAPPVTEVPFDVKPTSCRNPLNIYVSEKSMIPAAILGTADFDVSMVDPSTVPLAGAPALRHSMEDVTTPYYPLTGKQGAFDCTTEGPDGYQDMTLKFSAEHLINALGGPDGVEDDEVLVLPMTGYLTDGTAIAGEDVIVILKRGKGRK